jgi:hypothetical protein
MRKYVKTLLVDEISASARDLILYHFLKATSAHRNAVYLGHRLFAGTVVAFHNTSSLSCMLRTSESHFATPSNVLVCPSRVRRVGKTTTNS